MSQTLYNLVWCISLTFFLFIYVIFKLTLMALYHTKNILIIYLQSYYVGNIYAVVATKDSEWGGDYLLECCIEGNQTLIMSMTDDENIHFPIGSMDVEG